MFEYNIILFSLKQATILKEDLPGFLFESNRGTRHTFTAETSLGPEFAAGWTSKKTKRLRSKAEAIKQKVKTLAKDIYDSHFKVAQSKPRGVVAQLKDIVEDMSKVRLLKYIRLVHMPHPNAIRLGTFQGRELKKYCYITFVMKYFYKFLFLLISDL